MLTALKTIYGAVAERSLLTALSYIHISAGRAQASNGRITIDAPISGLDGMAFSVPAEKFVAAVAAAGDAPKVVLDGCAVRVSGGRFRAKIPTLGDEWPVVVPDASLWELEEPLLPMLQRMRPFMATDASNSWATCALCTTSLMAATNNQAVIGTRCTLLNGTGVERVAIPLWPVDELLRLKEEPRAFGITDGSLTFYLGDVWIKTQLIATEWPVEALSSLLGAVKMPASGAFSPSEVLAAVNSVLPFCKAPKFPIVVLGEDGVSTEEHEFSAAVTGIALPDIRCNAKTLALVLGVADSAWLIDEHRLGFCCDDGSHGLMMGVRE